MASKGFICINISIRTLRKYKEIFLSTKIFFQLKSSSVIMVPTTLKCYISRLM
jgi:hypothetical protein